jgi:hypothetical protein
MKWLRHLFSLMKRDGMIMTANFRAWYWPASALAAALASALLIYDFLTARAGRWMFRERLLDR